MYDATPQKKKGRKAEPALAALGGQVEGSEIGRGKESETLLINSVEIRTADPDDGDVLSSDSVSGSEFHI